MTELIKKALYFAAEKHDGQYRKGGRVPYIVHPVQVAFEIALYTSDEEIIAAALLHDTIEDCESVALRDIEARFGHRVANIVNEVTHSPEKGLTWKAKKESYLEKIREVSQEALMIIAIDKMCNLRAYFKALYEKNSVVNSFGGSPLEYAWYYHEIGNILRKNLKQHQLVNEYFTRLEEFDAYIKKDL